VDCTTKQTRTNEPGPGNGRVQRPVPGMAGVMHPASGPDADPDSNPVHSYYQGNWIFQNFGFDAAILEEIGVLESRTKK
jgi:hypothetical protein